MEHAAIVNTATAKAGHDEELQRIRKAQRVSTRAESRGIKSIFTQLRPTWAFSSSTKIGAVSATATGKWPAASDTAY